MRRREPILHGGRQRIRLVPDSVRAQVPGRFVRPGQGDAPGDALQFLAHRPIAKVEPHHAVGPDNPGELPPEGRQARHVLLRRAFLAPLSRIPIVALLPVRRRGHDALDRCRRQLGQPLDGARRDALRDRAHSSSDTADRQLR